MTTIRIQQRFCGPPSSANGGYAAGLIARALSGPVEVTLRAPPPLEVELALESEGVSATLKRADGALLAEAKRADFSLEVPGAVSFEAAERASAHFIGFRNHPYPSCFVCGPARPAALGAGLCLHPGAVTSGSHTAEPRVAAPFVPAGDLCDATGQLREEFVWAALDCPSWFGHATFATDVPRILLGRLTAEIARRPLTGERCVVQGWSLSREGRRIQCASALYGREGDCIARARAVWIELKS